MQACIWVQFERMDVRMDTLVRTSPDPIFNTFISPDQGPDKVC
jgi:hypothetical protein